MEGNYLFNIEWGRILYLEIVICILIIKRKDKGYEVEIIVWVEEIDIYLNFCLK